jgi:hypothetical protein
MRRSVILLASVLAVVFMVLSAAAPVLAATVPREIRSGTTTIAVNDHAVIGEFTTDQDQSVTPTLSYTVFVIGNGGSVTYDILLMNETNYDLYKSGFNFTYISAGSKLNQDGESTSISDLALTQNTHYFLVADNSNLPAGGSIPTQELRIGYILNGYDVSVQFPSGNPVVWVVVAIVALVIIVIIIIVVLLLYFLLRRRRAPQTMVPAPVPPPINPATPEGNCPVCGQQVRPDFYVCPNCGNRLK